MPCHYTGGGDKHILNKLCNVFPRLIALGRQEVLHEPIKSFHATCPTAVTDCLSYFREHSTCLGAFATLTVG